MSAPLNDYHVDYPLKNLFEDIQNGVFLASRLSGTKNSKILQ